MKRRVGIIILLVIIIFSMLFSGAGTIDTGRRLLSPSFSEPFGTDTLGRSLLERTAGGIVVSLIAASLTTALSLTAGLLLSYLYTLPRFPGELMLSITDSMKAVPSIVFALFLASLTGPGLIKLSVALAVSHVADVSKTAYSKISVLQKEGFIEAERSIGAGSIRIFFRHLLPHMTSYIAFQGVSIFLSAVIAESTLSFLGCGVPAPTPSLGSILSEGRSVMLSAPWMVAFPAIALLLLGTSLELIALSFSESDASSQ